MNGNKYDGHRGSNSELASNYKKQGHKDEEEFSTLIGGKVIPGQQKADVIGPNGTTYSCISGVMLSTSPCSLRPLSTLHCCSVIFAEANIGRKRSMTASRLLKRVMARERFISSLFFMMILDIDEFI